MKRSQQRHRARQRRRVAQADAWVRFRTPELARSAMRRLIDLSLERLVQPIVDQMMLDAELARRARMADILEFPAWCIARLEVAPRGTPVNGPRT